MTTAPTSRASSTGNDDDDSSDDSVPNHDPHIMIFRPRLEPSPTPPPPVHGLDEERLCHENSMGDSVMLRVLGNGKGLDAGQPGEREARSVALVASGQVHVEDGHDKRDRSGMSSGPSERPLVSGHLDLKTLAAGALTALRVERGVAVGLARHDAIGQYTLTEPMEHVATSAGQLSVPNTGTPQRRGQVPVEPGSQGGLVVSSAASPAEHITIPRPFLPSLRQLHHLAPQPGCLATLPDLHLPRRQDRLGQDQFSPVWQGTAALLQRAELMSPAAPPTPGGGLAPLLMDSPLSEASGRASLPSLRAQFGDMEAFTRPTIFSDAHVVSSSRRISLAITPQSPVLPLPLHSPPPQSPPLPPSPHLPPPPPPPHPPTRSLSLSPPFPSPPRRPSYSISTSPPPSHSPPPRSPPPHSPPSPHSPLLHSPPPFSLPPPPHSPSTPPTLRYISVGSGRDSSPPPSLDVSMLSPGPSSHEAIAEADPGSYPLAPDAGRGDPGGDSSTSGAAEAPTGEHSIPTPATSAATDCATPDNSNISTPTPTPITITTPLQPSYICTVPGCRAPPFQTQYLLNSHANVHSSARPHYCPVSGCNRSESGKGFKRKNEMIRHGLVHNSPGYACPFCPDKEHRYPRPDNLQRHVRVHHVDKHKDDPLLRQVLAQRPNGFSRGRRRRGPNQSANRKRADSIQSSSEDQQGDGMDIMGETDDGEALPS